jgi:hypothetical protein
MAATMATGMLQPDGRMMPEATFDVAHVAAAVVHIASLPPDVAVPHYTIMWVNLRFFWLASRSMMRVGLRSGFLIDDISAVHVS